MDWPGSNLCGSARGPPPRLLFEPPGLGTFPLAQASGPGARPAQARLQKGLKAPLLAGKTLQAALPPANRRKCMCRPKRRSPATSCILESLGSEGVLPRPELLSAREVGCSVDESVARAVLNHHARLCPMEAQIRHLLLVLVSPCLLACSSLSAEEP